MMFKSVVFLAALSCCGISGLSGQEVAPPMAARARLTSHVLVALNKQDNDASIIDLETGETLHRVATGLNPNEVAISFDGKTAVVTNMGYGARKPANTLTVFSLPDGAVTRTIDLGRHGTPHGVIFRDKSRVLVTSHDTECLVTVDIEKGHVESAIDTGEKGTHLVLLSPLGDRAYAVHAFTEKVTVIDLQKNEILARLACGKRAEGIALSPDGKLLSVGNVGGNSITLIDTRELKISRTIPDVLAPIRTCFSADGKSLYVSSPDELVVFDVKTWEVRERVRLSALEPKIKTIDDKKPIPMNFCHAPDQRSFFVVLINANAVAEFEAESLKLRRILETGVLPDGIAAAAISSAAPGTTPER